MGRKRFCVFHAEGKTSINSSSGNQRIGQLQAVSKSVLFDEGGSRRTDVFGKGQNSKSERAERLPNLAGLQLGSRALKKFHEGNDRQGTPRRLINRAGRRSLPRDAQIRTSVSKIISS